MRTLFLALLCTLVSSSVLSFPSTAQAAPKAKKASPQADIVVIAELIRGSGSMPHCGILAVVGEFEFRVIQVEKGQLVDKRIVVEALCPEMSIENFHLSRLELSTKRLYRYHPMNPLQKPPSKRLYLRKQEAFTFDYTALIGETLTSVSSKFTATKTSTDGWLSFGPGLKIQTSGNKVAKLRLTCPRGFPRSFASLGLPEVSWNRFRRKGGYSKGTFKTSSGVVGKAERGHVEFTLATD